MKQLAILLLLIMVVALFTACKNDRNGSQNNQEAAYKTITATEAKAMLDSDSNIILVDVRTPQEFQEKRIEGSILMPDYEIQKLAPSNLPNKDATILVYCRSGRRSALAAEALATMGYTNVYDFGGINDWTYETVSE